MRALASTATLLSAVLCASLVPCVANAQYFGKNKVDYHDVSFEVLETEHFDIYHYAAEVEAARLAARLAERWYARLALVLDHQLTDRQPLVLDREPARVRADHRRAGAARRRDWRRHRVLAPAHRHAVRADAGGDRSRARARARARLSVRHPEEARRRGVDARLGD